MNQYEKPRSFSSKSWAEVPKFFVFLYTSIAKYHVYLHFNFFMRTKQPAALSSSKIIAVVNNKGGVGKTTATVHIGCALASLGKRVLCVDMDTQANLAQNFFSRKFVNSAIKAVQNGTPLPPEHHSSGVDVLTLSFFEANEEGYKQAIHAFAGQYEYILIDSPPSLENRTISALKSSSYILIPTEAEQFAFSGISNLLQLAATYNLQVLGVFINKYDPKKQVHKAFRSFIADQFSQFFLHDSIPTSTVFPNAQAENKTGFEFYSLKKPNAALEAYQAIAKSIIEA
jgi:chromosome partitioning protein